MFCPKRTFLSDFVKFGSEILYLFLAEKVVVCCFVCFVVTLSDFGLGIAQPLTALWAVCNTIQGYLSRDRYLA